jgi:hypothetical protein
MALIMENAQGTHWAFRSKSRRSTAKMLDVVLRPFEKRQTRGRRGHRGPPHCDEFLDPGGEPPER